nr:GspH/FimT family protein [Pelotalea chapellei]
MKNVITKGGFALTELIVVIAIIGILLGIVSLNFFDWQRKTQIEKQTRELFTDINTARTESIFRKTRHRITFQPNSYVFKRYSSDNENSAAGTVISSRSFSYQLSRGAGGDISDNSLEFDGRGFLIWTNSSSSNLTLRVNPVSSGAAFDCIVIHTVRTNMGKMENGSCNAK